MLILSTFNSDYLQKPALEYPHNPLLESLTKESIEIKYVNKSLVTQLINLDPEKLKSCAILFRLFDFLDADLSIDETKLAGHLNLILDQIILIKQKSQFPFLAFLCPSPEIINEKLKEIEKKIIKKFNENKIHTLTVSNIKERYGDFEFENPIEEDTHIPYSPKFYAAIAGLLARKLYAINQKSCKVIAVDCDNTLWTGVAADDGPEGLVFKEHNILLQNYLVEQQKKGIIICLCSKNEEQTVLDVFEQRQLDMSLKLDHISKYKINWREKSDNVRELALDLNVFPDSFLFIDDNPIEIENVKQILGVVCITMPQNLQEYKAEWLFDIDEHAVITESDRNRGEFFKQAGIKTTLATQFRDPIDYLRSTALGQSITISKLDLKEKETLERVSQLSGKTNQFNIFPENKGKEICEINEMIGDKKKEVFVGRIKDNFSPIDITAISMCSIERNNITIDNFFVSCRSFGRGIEFEMLKHIAEFADKKSIKEIKIKFKKSDKNKAAGLFLNSLNQICNRSKPSLGRSGINFWLYACFKFLFKKVNVHLDFNLLELNKEIILTCPVQKLLEVDLDYLIRLSLKVSHKSTQTLQINKETIGDNNTRINENFLIEFRQMTSSLNYLVSKFFMDDKIIKPLTELENRVNTICNNLLGKKGQDKSLIARGLDSLKATELRYYLFESDNVNITISQLLCQKITASSLVEYIREQKKTSEVVSQNDDFFNPMLPSFQQKRLWLAEQKEQNKNSSNYYIVACYKIPSIEIISEQFKAACDKTLKLNVLYNSFKEINGDLQLSSKYEERQLDFEINEIESDLSIEEAVRLENSKSRSITSEESHIRFRVWTRKENTYLGIFMHHVISDGTSLSILLENISEIYNSNINRSNPQLQYEEYRKYQQRVQKDQKYQEKAVNFWTEKLSKLDALTTLPYDQPLLTSESATEQIAKRYNFSLSAEELSKLKKLVGLSSTTCFSALSALFALLISAYTYQENITLVTVTNGRNGHPSFNRIIGFFVNFLILNFNLDKNKSLINFFKQVNETILTSLKFQEISFDEIQKILLKNGISEILSNLVFVYQNYPIPKLKFGQETAELKVPKLPIIFDLRETCRFGYFTLFAQEYQDKLNFVVEYASDLFSLSFIEGFAKNFLHTITTACNNLEQSLQDLSVVCDEERKQLISLGQGPKLSSNEKLSLVSKFKQISKQYPTNIALSCDEKQLSYKEVDQQSDNLAHALIDARVKQGDYVGIFLGANYLFFIAELAILKLGAVFVPLSKEDPNERLQLIINDAKLNFFIVDDNHKGLFDTNPKERKLISIDLANNFTHLDKELPRLEKSTGEFCILYTSGSTGTPKGVILQEKGILRVMETPKKEKEKPLHFIGVLPGERMAQTANQVFDAAQLECWLAWLHGANLVIFDKETLLNITKFRNKLRTEKIIHIWLTAGLFDFYANNQPDIFATKDIKTLMVGGDVVHKNAVLKVLNFTEAPIIINGYGPTETSIFVLTHTFNKQTINNYNTTLIGSPINETEIEIITPFGSKVPLGGIGELVVRGEGVAKGYLNSLLDKNRFTGELDNRSYHTGDLVKYTTKDPQIMFMGRKDSQQIKINGNLVSLEEIRSCLSRYPAIKQIEVGIVEKQIVAFYTLKSTVEKITNEEFCRHLSKSLPFYMFPKCYVEVEDFLVNANGKLDKNQFEKLESEFNKKQLQEISPQTPNGKAILKIIKERLTAFPNNIKANFFHYGCNSITVMELIKQINDKFKSNLVASDLYGNPTIEELEESLIGKVNKETKKRSLRLLKPGGDSLPIVIFLPPAGGGLSIYQKLIKSATINNTCYGIEDRLLENFSLELLSMQEMARDIISLIMEKKQDKIIVGFSFAGMMALEVVRFVEDLLKKLNESEKLKEKVELIEKYLKKLKEKEKSEEGIKQIQESLIKFLSKIKVVLLDTREVSSAPIEIQSELKIKSLEHCEKQREKMNKDKSLSHLFPDLKKLCEHQQKIGFQYVIEKVGAPVFFIGAENPKDHLFSEIPPKKYHKKIFEAKETTHFDMLDNPDKNGVAMSFSALIEKINLKAPKKHSSISAISCNSNLFQKSLIDPNLQTSSEAVATKTKSFRS